MLSRSQIHTLLLSRKRGNTLFSKLPRELIQHISEFGQDPQNDFAITLKHVARGELQAAQALLEKASKQEDKTKLKELLLSSGTVVTRAGLTVSHKTLLECALGEGDPEMAAMMMSYFTQFEGGEQEKDRQLERYRPLIEEMLNQKPYDLTELIDIIKKSSAEEVDAALKKDMEHKSDLREAFIQFRQAVSPGLITKPQLHYNYQTLLHALKLLDSEWDNLFQASGNNYAKCDLVWRQVIGYLQRGLPAVDRFAFARGLYDLVEAKKPLERSAAYKYGEGSFPDTNPAGGCSCVGLGFDFGIGAKGVRGVAVWGRDRGGWGGWPLSKLISNKNSRLSDLMPGHPKPKSGTCVIV